LWDIAADFFCCAERAWADGPDILLYGEVRGYRPLRDLIAARMAARGVGRRGRLAMLGQ